MEEKQIDRAASMERIDRFVSMIFTALTWVAIAAVVYIMLNTTVNVISRAFFKNAINGSVQTSQIVMALVALCALPIVTMYNTHIKVDVVAEKLPQKGQDALQIMNLILCGIMQFVCGYYTFLKTAKAKTMGLAMDVPPFPHWPIYLLIAIMLIISGICAFYNVFHFVKTGTVITATTFRELKDKHKALKAVEGKEGTES